MSDCEKCIHYCVCVVNEYCHEPCGYYEEQRSHGEWIEKEDYNMDTYYDCSVCGNSWCTLDGTPWQNGIKFCPNCGASMGKRVKRSEND